MSNSLVNTLPTTEYSLFSQTGVYHGKVRDVYAISDKYIAIIATDRISAFDRILPREIPYKGQVLNQMAAYFLGKTSDIIPNWLLKVPDPNASLGLKADPVKIELVIRGCLVGHAWREYKSGKRELCGAKMPENMHEYQTFLEPIITPTTKAETGHDEDITPEEAIEKGLVTEAEWAQITAYMKKLFARGQQMAEARGLVLADTKYEFGRLNGKIILIDEIHTPDSSRYFYKDGYDNFISSHSSEPPKHLSKEFVRSWLTDRGFSGKSGQDIPEMSDEFVNSISERYIELYEDMTGEKFVPSETVDITRRIEDNVNKAIKELG